MQRRPASTAVHVKAPARLHLGFVDLHGGLGRKYGSIGLAVDAPATEIVVRPAEDFRATGPEQKRAMALLERLSEALKLPGRYAVETTSAIPAHAGLGSGTQLALAIGSALIELEHLSVTPRQLGEVVERGARSAIGMAAFEQGGFIVDGGRGKVDHAPPVIARTHFPDAWRVLLVLDSKNVGVHGEKETAAFAALPPFPEAAAGRLCRLTLMQLLPALHERDIATFGKALSEIQEIVGGHFSSAQGGSPWSSPDVAHLVKQLADGGAVGVGQSSWGPTGFAFVDSEAAAGRLYSTLVEDATARGLEILVVRGRNAGASVESIE